MPRGIYRFWEETHVKCEWCGKWYNPELPDKIYNVADEREFLGLPKDDTREDCCHSCYNKLLRAKKNKEREIK